MSPPPLKKIRKRAIAGTEPAASDGVTRITLSDQTVFEVPSSVSAVLERTTVRRLTREVVEPVTVEGIDHLKISVDGRETVDIGKDDVGSFGMAPVPELSEHDQSLTMSLSITTLYFLQGNKWKLSDGDRRFFATIEDEAFLERVDKGRERFAKGDILRCQVRLQQWRTDTGLRTDWIVSRVIEHITPAEPLRLPFDDRSPDQPDSN